MTKMDTHDPPTTSAATAIILIAAALMSIGLVMVASASASLDSPVLRTDFWRATFGRQLVFAALGLAAILFTARIGHRMLRWRPGRWFQPSVLFFAVTIGCLALVLVPGIGVMRNGARRWLHFGPPDYGLGFQPSELAKLALVVLLAAYLSGRQHRLSSFWSGALPTVAAIGLCVGLVGSEDFGTAALLALVGTLMLLAGGVRWRHLLLMAAPAIAAFIGLLLAKPYRLQRLTGFLDIWSDPQGQGYHPIQSLITIASGGWFGTGLGAGVQKYGYLPEARTDFIFAVWCEETGLVGALLVILLFATLLFLGIRASAAAPTLFGRLLAIGVTLMITLQAALNIAVVTASVPPKGIALPLVSAGGSGVVLLSVAVGLLVSVARAGGRRGTIPLQTASPSFVQTSVT
ncbi:MAG TPA: putative peptidoglycan glycosyltransferase FtsW [Phycisphaerae bacterium]|nr:putative peptidoglycan glycosyltransferase FtsW [Phycisphaerae bacterium]